MAKTSAKMNMAMPQVMIRPMMQPHGMSLAVKPQRKPHPTAPGRDTFGRMMPGTLMANAAPPFKANKTTVMKKPTMRKPPQKMMPPPTGMGW